MIKKNFKILKNRIFRKYYEKLTLYLCKKKEFFHGNLSFKIDLNSFFNNKKTEKMFFLDELKKQEKKLEIPEDTGGVNPGDQRAIYYLIKELHPKKILEIGTHIGSSTVSIALAMQNILNESYLKTVDIRDVNNETLKPWVEHMSKNSPVNNLKLLNLDKFVEFVVSDSINFLKNENQKYDFIFLDGSHNADYVYNEISFSLKILNPNGIILLHDYFPDGKKIWENKEPILGPYEGVRRVIKENPEINIEPFLNLPWETKLKSNASSLAVLYQN
jgi:predicted O-methyltransferase YrrM